MRRRSGINWIDSYKIDINGKLEKLNKSSSVLQDLLQARRNDTEPGRGGGEARGRS